MIRRLLAAGLLVLLLAASAGPLLGQNVMVGAKGGVNIANVDTDDPELADSESRTGLVGGVFLSIGLGDVFALQPELLFSQKGFSLTEGNDELGAELDYFAIPLLLKLMLPIEDSSVRPGIYAGGVVSFESSCGLTGVIDGVTVDQDCDVTIDGEEFTREKTDYGLVFGAEVQVDVGGVVLLVDGRYDLGLRNLEPAEEEASVMSRTWSFMAGVGIPLN